jgi:thymidylate synthase
MINLEYKQLINAVLNKGELIESRNSLTKRYTNLSVSFTETPLVTIRKTAWKNALREFEWFLSGSNNINDLHPAVHNWWSPWKDQDGIIKNNYSKQFTEFAGTTDKLNQIDYMENLLKTDPYSRRNVITTWNTTDMVNKETPITNCHGTVIQAFVKKDNTLDLTMYQRSADLILGVPHNWIQYWAFMHYLASRAGLKVGKFNWIGGDVHIYKDHWDVAQKILDATINEVGAYTAYTPTSDKFKANDFNIATSAEPVVTQVVRMIV